MSIIAMLVMAVLIGETLLLSEAKAGQACTGSNPCDPCYEISIPDGALTEFGGAGPEDVIYIDRDSMPTADYLISVEHGMNPGETDYIKFTVPSHAKMECEAKDGEVVCIVRRKEVGR